MRWAITSGSSVVGRLCSWDIYYLSEQLRLLGKSVSLTATEPAEAVVFGTVAIRPVTDVAVAFDEETQVVVDETVAYANGTVSATKVVAAKPVVDPTTPEMIAGTFMGQMRQERDRLIDAIQWRVLRNYRQVQNNETPTDDATKMTAIYEYMKDLADMPQDNPDTDTQAEYNALVWPTVPA